MRTVWPIRLVLRRSSPRPRPLPAPATPPPLLGCAGLDRRGDIGTYGAVIGPALVYSRQQSMTILSVNEDHKSITEANDYNFSCVK